MKTMVHLVVFSILLLITETVAFQCYVCDSKNDIECLESLPKNSRLQPQECHNITGAKYCIKTTNIYAGELGTKRFCAANDHGNYCKYVRQPTGDRDYRSCVLTCYTENCNGSIGMIDKQATLYMATLMISITCFLSMRSLLSRPQL